MKLVQVFDWLKMPHPLSTNFQDWAETNNDSYVRWYPNRISSYMRFEQGEELNNWLLGQGMDISNCDDPYFYVLIHVSW